MNHFSEIRSLLISFSSQAKIDISNKKIVQSYVDSKGEFHRNQQSLEDVLKSVNNASLLTTNIYNKKFFDISYPNWRWRDWTREGVAGSITADKPVYKPDDLLQARVYYFNFTNKFPVDCSNFNPNFDIIDSSDTVIFTKKYDYNSKCSNSSKLFEYQIPKDMKGGVYYISISDYSLPSSKIKFRVRDFQ